MMNQITLSNASLYPLGVASTFLAAQRLGFSGVEIMVYSDKKTPNNLVLADLVQKYSQPIRSLHVPCLLFSRWMVHYPPRTRLMRTVEMAAMLGVKKIVVHPPFVWQPRYRKHFAELLNNLHDVFEGIDIYVENMFPWRADWLLPSRLSAKKPLTQPANLPASLCPYVPSFNPALHDYAHYALDVSHCVTSRINVVELARAMTPRLGHVHISDGTGSAHDEHALPGTGIADIPGLLTYLHSIDYSGDYVLEINTQQYKQYDAKLTVLAQGLDYITRHLKQLTPLEQPSKTTAHNP